MSGCLVSFEGENTSGDSRLQFLIQLSFKLFIPKPALDYLNYLYYLRANYQSIISLEMSLEMRIFQSFYHILTKLQLQ